MANSSDPRGEARSELEEQLKNDNRDVADLWKEALKSYKGIVGLDLQRKFDNAKDMLDYGTVQMNNFHRFRHDEGKVDRLRTLFSSNLELVGKGASLTIAAASPSFPPAEAIGTALTYILQACKSVSADYDVIIVFFDDMNSFLSRITILESRLPKLGSYQNCLMEVFTSLLVMCGFAQKYIELGRFKKWIHNLFLGDDGELGEARSDMTRKIDRLQQATEFAILGNTDETLKMTAQLDENQRSHQEMLQEVGQAINIIHENTENIKDDMAKLLKLFGEQGSEKHLERPQGNKPPSANSIRNSLPVVGRDDHEYRVLKETLLPESCTWVFSEREWGKWLNMEDGTRPMLAITGHPGSGKSHLAASIHDKLEQMAREDETGNTAVAHFYFREQEETFSYFLCGIVTVVNQIAETNYVACEKISAQRNRDDIHFQRSSLWQGIAKHLLGAVFEKDAKLRLFIVFDGLDELRDWPNFKTFWSNFVVAERLKVSLVVTTRPERLEDLPESTRIMRIEMTKEKQRQDLKSLIWYYINSLGHLKRFSRYVQQRISDTVEESSPNMLYAKHFLVRLDNLGREGAVLKSLQKEKPEDLHGVYEILLSECQRRMPVSHQQVAASLLHWIAFAFPRKGLTLTDIQSLVKYLSQDDEFDLEDIPELFSKFLKVGDPGDDAEFRAKLQASRLTTVQDLKQDSDNKDAIYDDGPLPVMFQERSMRNYFTNTSHSSSPFRWGPSEAHRRIFLISVKIIGPGGTEVSEGLQKYCGYWLIEHWTNIEISKHTPQEQVEVLEAFAEAMSGMAAFSETLGRAGIMYRTAIVNERRQEWAKLYGEEENIREALSKFAADWWQKMGHDPSACLSGLARRYLHALYRALNSQDAIQAWDRLRGVLNMSGLVKLLIEQARVNFPEYFEEGKEQPEDEIGADKKLNSQQEGSNENAILGILNLFGDEIKPDAGAHRAVSEVLAKNNFLDAAEKTCKAALDLCNPNDDEWYRASCSLSDILLCQKKMKEAYKVVHAAVDQLPTNNVSPQLKRAVYTACARAERRLRLMASALDSYVKGKSADPDGVTTAEDLLGELEVTDKKRNKSDYIRVLKNWSLLERITWLASNYEHEGEDRLALFCDIATQTNEKDFIVTFYEESISFLDNLEAGTPLRVDLALIYFEVCRDPEKALIPLNELFDSHATGLAFPITGVNATEIISRAVETMANVQVELFRKSRDPVYKAERLKSLVGLMQRPLSLDVPRVSPFWVVDQRMGIAYMYMVIGPLEKFQEVVQSLLDDSFAGLSDSVGWNDVPYLWMLTQALGLLSRALRNDKKIHRYARIVGSAIFSRLSKDDEDKGGVNGAFVIERRKVDTHKDPKKQKAQKEDQGNDKDKEAIGPVDEDITDTDSDGSEIGDPPEDEGDLVNPETALFTCGGFCSPSRQFRWWGDRSMYLYITYSGKTVCDKCQEEYEAIQRGEGTYHGRYFYGIGHEYLKLPIEGWRGVRNGMLTLEGEEPVSMDDFLGKLRDEVCKDAWERLWAGDAY